MGKKKRGVGGNPEVPSGSLVQLNCWTGSVDLLLTQLPVTCDWGETWKTLILSWAFVSQAVPCPSDHRADSVCCGVQRAQLHELGVDDPQ